MISLSLIYPYLLINLKGKMLILMIQAHPPMQRSISTIEGGNQGEVWKNVSEKQYEIPECLLKCNGHFILN
jgi:hypothetical protein